jgi:steroid delta-isomerase-like uncharacterized protein
MSTKGMRSQTSARVQAWNRHDPDAFVAHYAKDATVYDPMYAEPLRGRDAIRRDFEEFMTAFPDTDFSVGAVVVHGGTVAFEVSARGTHKGPLASPAGLVPATNRSIHIPIAAFAHMDEEGLVVEERRYYDVAGLMQQLGLMPA